ncbi:MAG: sulfotransferase [Deltaproteobacteria bacterium]|nr:sulfotransferase [Deltaproteobacteria bacterium]
MSWSPPPRPEWARNLIAHGEALGDPDLLLPLEAEELVERARRSTGLDDFGPDSDWKPHFEILVEALARESRLHLIGRILAGTELLRSLCNRLRVTELWRRRPEILGTPIDAPVFIVGAARSGTSITHELFARDPASRVPLLWEMLHPAEACEGPDLSEVADHTMQFWHQLQPEYRAMHFNSGRLANECLHIFMQNFVSDQFGGCHQVPTYEAHLQALDQRFVYAEHRRILQTLEPGSRSARWVLKAPSHLPRLRFLFSVYPDARIVWTHRDPQKTLASGLSLLGTLKWMRCAEVDLSPWIAALPAGQAWLFQDVIEAREKGELPDAQFIDVRYADLMRDPATTIADIYARLGWDTSEPVSDAMRSYVENRPRGHHGRHVYSLAEFGLDSSVERERFASYRDRFGVPEEA